MTDMTISDEEIAAQSNQFIGWYGSKDRQDKSVEREGFREPTVPKSFGVFLAFIFMSVFFGLLLIAWYCGLLR